MGPQTWREGFRRVLGTRRQPRTQYSATPRTGPSMVLQGGTCLGVPWLGTPWLYPACRLHGDCSPAARTGTGPPATGGPYLALVLRTRASYVRCRWCISMTRLRLVISYTSRTSTKGNPFIWPMGHIILDETYVESSLSISSRSTINKIWSRLRSEAEAGTSGTSPRRLGATGLVLVSVVPTSTLTRPVHDQYQ